MLENVRPLSVCEILQNCVNAIFLPIIHIVFEHLDYFLDIEFPSSTETKEKGVVEPRIDVVLLLVAVAPKLGEASDLVL